MWAIVARGLAAAFTEQLRELSTTPKKGTPKGYMRLPPTVIDAMERVDMCVCDDTGEMRVGVSELPNGWTWVFPGQYEPIYDYVTGAFIGVLDVRRNKLVKEDN